MPLFLASSKRRIGTKIHQTFQVTLPGGKKLGVKGLHAKVEITNTDLGGGGWQSVFFADSTTKLPKIAEGFKGIRQQRGSITVYPDPDNPKASIVYYEVLTDPDIKDKKLESGATVIADLTRDSVIDLATHVASRADNPKWVKSQTPTVEFKARTLPDRGRMQ